MSRSIHQTRRELLRTRRFEYADPEWRGQHLRRVRQALQTKRAVKRAIREERRLPVSPSSPVDPETIPIHVVDAGPYVHYPASPEDLRGLMRLLPPGSLDGVRSIELCLGREDQDTEDDPDPLVGRSGAELFPGVYAGFTRAEYLIGRGRLRIFGYVYDPDHPQRPLFELYLRLKMLGSFIHELAHHDDRVRRFGRGRWWMRAEDNGQAEIYARSIQHTWVREYVVPHLHQRYPDETATLERWILEHGGIALGLADVAGDPREIAKGGMLRISAFLDVSDAFESLVESVLKDESPLDARLRFAEQLHWAERDIESRQIVEDILSQHPNHLPVQCLLACVLRCDSQYAAAQQVIEGILATDDSCDRAWELLVSVHERQENWPGLLMVASRLLELRGRPDARTLASRARARLELSDLDGCHEDVAALRQLGTRTATRMAAKLEVLIADRDPTPGHEAC